MKKNNLYILPWEKLVKRLHIEKYEFVYITFKDNIKYVKYGNCIREYNLSNFSIANYEINVLNKIVEGLDNYSPILSRWIHKGYTHENVKEFYTIRILRIMSLIEELSISRGIFPTGVSHHMDTYCFELALNLCNKEQIFLYPESISSRILPLIQTKGISTRKRLNIKISDYSYQGKIKKLLNRGKIQPKKSKKQIIFNYIKVNFYLAFLYLLMRKIKQISTNLLIIYKFKKSNPNNSYYFSETFLSDFELINNQRKFLKKYETKAKAHKISSSTLVFMAHYQPESTSFPESGRIYSHINIISHLRSIGFNEIIYYKEHWASLFYIEGGPAKNFITSPSRVGMNRSIDYIKYLEELNCKLLPIKSNLDDYKNLVPITLTGSIAIERSLQGLHTLYTGYPWWKGLPGTISIWELDKSLTYIPKEWSTPNSQIKSKTKEFLLDVLNNKTIENIFGIGMNEKIILSNKFKGELKNLIKILHN